MEPGELITRYFQTKREHFGKDNDNDVEVGTVAAKHEHEEFGDANEGMEVKSESSIPTVFEAGSLADRDIDERTISAAASEITADDRDDTDDDNEDDKPDSL